MFVRHTIHLLTAIIWHCYVFLPGNILQLNACSRAENVIHAASIGAWTHEIRTHVCFLSQRRTSHIRKYKYNLYLHEQCLCQVNSHYHVSSLQVYIQRKQTMHTPMFACGNIKRDRESKNAWDIRLNCKRNSGQYALTPDRELVI
jgi:hypothetical protein